MKNVFRKISNIFLSGVIACIGILPFWSVPVLADTTYFSYGQFLSNSSGNKLYGINLSVSPINFAIGNYNNGSSRYYNVYYFAYALSSISYADAQANLNNDLGISSVYDLMAIRYTGSPGNWSYGTAFSWSAGVFTLSNSSGSFYGQYYYVALNPDINLFSCYARAGSLMISSSTNNNNNAAYVKNAIFAKEGISLESGYSASSFAGGWVKDDTAITPVYDMSGLGGTGQIEGEEPEPSPSADPEPSPSADPEGGEGDESGSSFQQQQQFQTIAEGAVAFTVEDGAFSQSQSQTIEENAVNVTVNNNNALTQENYQELNSLINNYNGSSSDENDPFQQAIGNFQAFHAIALAFAGLASIVFGWLPWWVTALLGAMFSMVCVFIVLRLIHLFK